MKRTDEQRRRVRAINRAIRDLTGTSTANARRISSYSGGVAAAGLTKLLGMLLDAGLSIDGLSDMGGWTKVYDDHGIRVSRRF